MYSLCKCLKFQLRRFLFCENFKKLEATIFCLARQSLCRARFYILTPSILLPLTSLFFLFPARYRLSPSFVSPSVSPSLSLVVATSSPRGNFLFSFYFQFSLFTNWGLELGFFWFFFFFKLVVRIKAVGLDLRFVSCGLHLGS